MAEISPTSAVLVVVVISVSSVSIAHIRNCSSHCRAALVSIGKHLGMFVDRQQIQERKQISAEPMSAEEWKRQFVREG